MDDAKPLTIGILGLDRRGQFLLTPMAEMPGFRIVAVADRDTQAVEKKAAQLGCRAFDDYRQFVLQGGFDYLLVAANLHNCLEHVRLAVKSGCHVLKLAPMARSFEEAAELYELARQEGRRFDVVNTGRYTGSFQAFQARLADGRIERPCLVRAFCEVGLLAGMNPELYQIYPDSQTSWITDQDLAGGGVLLQNCYTLIDQLVLAFGLPRRVYCLCNSHTSDKQQLHHLTEDTALVSMRFGENLIVDLVAMRHWDDRPAQETLTLYGRDRQGGVSGESLVVRDPNGASIEQARFDCDETAISRALLADYQQSFLDPEPHRYTSDAASNLRVMAVMQAAYLSSRTGSPEDPQRILSLVGQP